MKKIRVLGAVIVLLYSCSNDLQETLPEQGIHEEDPTAKGLNIGRWYNVSDQWGSPEWTHSGDFNNDGKEDIISLSDKNAYMKLSNGEAVNNATSQVWITDGRYGSSGYTFTGDFNGDGFADIASAHYGTFYMKLNNHRKGFINANWNVDNAWGGSDYTLVGDFTGDGKSDIASAYYSLMYMKISRGNAFSSQTWSTDGQYGGGDYTYAGDYNGDGKDDIISLYYGTIFIKESTGTRFISKSHTTSNNWGSSAFTWMADTDTDGKDEIITAIDNVILKREWISGQSWSLESLLTPRNWGGEGYNFSMDYTGDGSDEIVSAIGGRLFAH